MFSVDSAHWRVRALSSIYAMITQRASGAQRMVTLDNLPSFEALAAMHEKRFDAAMRAAFFGDTDTPRKGIY